MPKQKNDDFLLGSLKKYYLNIHEKPKVFLAAYSVLESGSCHTYDVSPETYVILHILYDHFDFESTFGKLVDVSLMIAPETSSESIVKVTKDMHEEKWKRFQLLRMTDENVEIEIDSRPNNPKNSILDIAMTCDRPSIVLLGSGCRNTNYTIISGLSSIIRFLFKLVSIKDSKFETKFGSLLGFRGGCLQACAESSIWTKFCEVDVMRRMMKTLESIGVAEKEENLRKLSIPIDLVRLEYHLDQPVKMHNFRKRIRNEEQNVKEGLSGRCKVEEAIRQIPHTYTEGPDMTLADLILFPCVELALLRLGIPLFETYLPNVLSWIARMRAHNSNRSLESQLAKLLVTEDEFKDSTNALPVQLPVIPKESLYKSDTLRYNPKLRLFTKQDDIDESLQVLTDSGIELMNPEANKMLRLDLNEMLDWSKIPPAAQLGVEGGQLPESRKVKKNQQLANLVQMIQFIYTKYECRRRCAGNIRIVDFCSGGGHLGILIGYLFPDAQILLVENKEESLRRARDRVETLNLTNISFAQCNLTSFSGKFDIGVGLHCCGTATDLILSKCVKAGASFVVCPCCYGGIQCGGDILYPRSETLRQAKGMTLEKYLVLAHSSDQTHEEAHEKTNQGRVSMRAVDTDRLLAFDEVGYKTWLRRIVPWTASPKNHILVGFAPPT